MALKLSLSRSICGFTTSISTWINLVPSMTIRRKLGGTKGERVSNDGDLTLCKNVRIDGTLAKHGRLFTMSSA